jgi:putative membrane protein
MADSAVVVVSRVVAVALAVAGRPAIGSRGWVHVMDLTERYGASDMTLLSEIELQQVAQTIARVERDTDAEIVTVLAARADDYAYIPLLWASLIALIVPGLLNYSVGLFGPHELLLVQWALFILLALLFRVPAITTRLIPHHVRRWRAGNVARRQFLEQNLHHTRGETGMLIFVSEAERHVEILVDRGISARVPDATWEPIIAAFTGRVRKGETLQGFLDCIESCGTLLAQHLPATSPRNELPNRLVVLP